LASFTGSVDQDLLLRNAHLVTENCSLRQQITGQMYPTSTERRSLAEIGKKLGKKALEEVASLVMPDTLTWYSTLVAKKLDGSQKRRSPGRSTIDAELEALVVRLAKENASWEYDRRVSALANLGDTISDQTIGNLRKRHSIPPALKRKQTTTGHEFIRMHMDRLVVTDFFTTGVWTWCGLLPW
jgi:hypothetical protein